MEQADTRPRASKETYPFMFGHRVVRDCQSAAKMIMALKDRGGTTERERLEERAADIIEAVATRCLLLGLVTERTEEP